MKSTLIVCYIQVAYIVIKYSLIYKRPSWYAQSKCQFTFVWLCIFVAQVTVFCRMVFERYRHSGQVCSGDWDFYMYQGEFRDDVAKRYDPYYLIEDGDMIRFYVVFFAWIWGISCGCFACIFGTGLGIVKLEEEEIYRVLDQPNFKRKFKRYKKYQEEKMI